MNDLLKRTLTGAVYVASVLAAICFNPIISSIYFGIIGLIALSEFYNITSKNCQKIKQSKRIAREILRAMRFYRE